MDSPTRSENVIGSVQLAQLNEFKDHAEPRGRTRMRRIWFGAVIVLLVAIGFLFDGPIDDWVKCHSNPSWKFVAELTSKYANLPSLLLFSVILGGIGLYRKRRDWQKLALALALSSCLSGLVSSTIRATTGRTRPSAVAKQGWYGMRHDSQWLVGKHDFNSFPSGHMGTAMGFSGLLLLGARRWQLPALALGITMGWARVYLQCHHLSDILVAALIGLAIGNFTWRWITSHLFRTDPPLASA